MAVQHLKTAEFDEAVSKGLVLVDFWATWCGPCRMLAPVIERLADRYDGSVKVCKVDIDEEPSLAERFGVMSIPTVMVFKDGRQVAQTVGVQPEDAFVRMIDAAK